MRKWFLGIFIAFLFLFLRPSFIEAIDSGYIINNFNSKITLNQNTSLNIKEKIEVEFLEPRHGIFRIIPFVYPQNGKVFTAKIKILSITDEDNQPSTFTMERYNQSLKIKIGDVDKTIIGLKTYVLTYQINRVLLSDQDQPEIYWNVTGSEWDTQILRASAIVVSDWAKIEKVDCFAGQANSQEKLCQTDSKDNQAQFTASQSLGFGQDLTLVVGLSTDNQLVWPGFWQHWGWWLTDNWGWLIAILPLLMMFLSWWFWGRDQRYLADNIYYQPDNQESKKVSPFARLYLPLVYHPIDNLTPAQVGTIFDEKVDLKDIIAEIVELARLGYLKIEKIKTKKLFFKSNDYRLIDTGKDKKILNDYQIFLHHKLFGDKKEIKISQLKTKFAPHLDKIKKLIYQSLVTKKVFPQNPLSVRLLWVSLLVFLSISFLVILIIYVTWFSNPAPLFLFFASLPLAFWLALKMSRKTAWGYALYQQARGLRFYLSKGKWRHEIAEKNLFFDEILPLSIALGVVDQLIKEMADLGVQVPNYLQGFAAASLSRDLNNFKTTTASSLSFVSAASGRSSWSGGSGFSGGGSSGGGFGGGGGGSW